jgi:hypothetical protein
MREKYRAVKIPLKGWLSQVWCQYTGQYEDTPNSPLFKNPDFAIFWAVHNWDD